MKTVTALKILALAGAVVVGTISPDAYATSSGTTFSTIGSNVIGSIRDLPNLLTGLAYMFGILLAVLGIMKIKDHVENPGNTPLKDGAIRLAAGGGLFAIPIVTQAMKSTVGSSSGVSAASLSPVTWGSSGTP